jgi:hypothetical protein
VGDRPPPGPPPPVVPVVDVEKALSTFRKINDALEATIARGSALTDDQRNRRVNDEWSTIESFRHIVFVIDLWLRKGLSGEEDAFHPIGLPPHFVPAAHFGLDTDVRPSFDDACDVLRQRLALLRDYVEALTPEELERPVANHAKTAGGALSVIFDELTAHDSFINRDMDLL